MRLSLCDPGLICAGASDADALFGVLCEHKSAIGEISNFTANKSFTLARVCEPLPAISKPEFATRTNALVLHACLQIEREISRAVSEFGAHRVGVVIGTTTSGVEENYKNWRARNFSAFSLERNSHANPANFIRDYFGLKSVAMGISSACTSGNKALIEAVRLIKFGICDAVIFGGAESLDELSVQGFDALGILSDEPVKPFSDELFGTNLGEGACVFVLSRAHSSDICFLGAGANSDAYHITKPDPSAKMQICAIKDALNSANLLSVDYINLHGTGTMANDVMESVAIAQTLPRVPASSSKWAFAHTLGAAGAIELAVCFKAIEKGVIPPNSASKGAQNFNLITQPMRAQINTAMNINFAFGGDNAVSIIGRV